jgi:hypothetical protein
MGIGGDKEIKKKKASKEARKKQNNRGLRGLRRMEIEGIVCYPFD